MSEWVNIKDRLPECPEKGDIDVIICSYNHDKNKFHIMPAAFFRGHFYNPVFNEAILIDDPFWPITHWMYLPEPPRKSL